MPKALGMEGKRVGRAGRHLGMRLMTWERKTGAWFGDGKVGVLYLEKNKKISRDGRLDGRLAGEGMDGSAGGSQHGCAGKRQARKVYMWEWW